MKCVAMNIGTYTVLSFEDHIRNYSKLNEVFETRFRHPGNASGFRSLRDWRPGGQCGILRSTLCKIVEIIRTRATIDSFAFFLPVKICSIKVRIQQGCLRAR